MAAATTPLADTASRDLAALQTMALQGASWVPHETLRVWERNPRVNAKAVPRVAASIQRFGFVAPIVVWLSAGRMVAGHTRLAAVRQLLAADSAFVARGAPGVGLVRVVFHEFRDEAEADAYAIADNRLAELADWDEALLREHLDAMDAQDRAIVGYGPDDGPLPGDDLPGSGNTGTAGSLQARFVVPPFTVLDARQGYWQDRKRAWTALGLDAQKGREHLGVTVNASEGKHAYMSGRGPSHGGSIFDPVLCEVAYRWFCPPNGSVLDPFAGEATKGVVAGVLGLQYTGVELRAEQVAANQAMVAAISAVKTQPTYVQGDSEQLERLLPPGMLYDFIWTSPPYYDLEIYSQSDKDGSAFETYDRFIGWYERIFAQCVARLRPNRFLGVKVGEVRDKRTGAYRNFVGDNAAIFRRLGLEYYNEAILVTPLGSVPIRAANGLQSTRKLGKTHQNVLLFYKGDPRTVGQHFANVVEAGDDLPAADA